MLVGHFFEILVSFWLLGGQLGACWQLKGVIGAFGAENGRLEGGGTPINSDDEGVPCKLNCFSGSRGEP